MPTLPPDQKSQQRKRQKCFEKRVNHERFWSEPRNVKVPFYVITKLGIRRSRRQAAFGKLFEWLLWCSLTEHGDQMLWADFKAETGSTQGDIYRARTYCKPDGKPHDKPPGSSLLLNASFWIQVVFAGVIIKPAMLATLAGTRDNKDEIWEGLAKTIQRKAKRQVLGWAKT